MKKQSTTDAKRAAANDVEKDEAKAPKATKAEKPAERYQIGQTDTVKRGFLKEFCKAGGFCPHTGSALA
jgi:hypothetical protein